jgi:hypothetical protein
MLLAGTLAGCARSGGVFCAATNGSDGRQDTATACQGALSGTALAAKQARGLLHAFRAPTGSTALAARPAGTPASLANAPTTPVTSDLVQQTAWYTITGTPAAVLARIKARPPVGLTPAGSTQLTSAASGPRASAPVYALTYAWPPIANEIAQQTLSIAAASIGSDTTVLRLDAQVVWIPKKPTGDVIPATAKALTAAPHAGLGAADSGDASISTQDPEVVDRVASLLDSLPLFPPGARSCPAGNGANVLLTFRKSTAGSVVATALVGASGCDTVQLTVGGTKEPVLAGNAELVTEIEQALGAHWSGLGIAPHHVPTTTR